MTQRTGDPMVGQTVGQYEILARLGGGGMGVVYKAQDRKLGRPVALKFLPQQWSHDPGARERFLREAQAASATQHQNICTIHDVDTTGDGQLFIVMAYYEGQTLKRRLEGGPLPIDEALEIASQVAEGLAKAHAAGVIHRDIKPGNLILTEDGVRIVDFGLATLVDALQITVHGSTLGTAAYMSPEQVRGETVDARTDVWSLGVVLYEMLAGHVPFRGSYAEAISYAIRTDAPPPLRATRPEVPEEVEQLVFRALHKERAIRYASGREMARALRDVRGLTVPMDLRTQVIEPPAGTVAPPRKRGRIRSVVKWATVALVAVVAAAGAWVFAPQARLPVVVAPVFNLTRYSELNPYSPALTLLATLELGDSRDVRALPYQRLLPILRPLLPEAGSLPTPDVVAAIGRHAAADVLVVPILEYDNATRLWQARAELRDPTAGPVLGDDVTVAPVQSAIRENAAAQLMAALAQGIEQRFTSRRSRIRRRIESLVGMSASRAPVIGSLDAAQALAKGLSALDAGEYHTARVAFLEAAALDAANPLPLAWASRAATLMGQENEARDSATRAAGLLTARTRPHVRLFVEAVAAEVEAEADIAAVSYAELASTYDDEPWWLFERGGYEERQGLDKEALATFDTVVKRDAGNLRAAVDLCRADNRLGERAAARQQAERALEAYRALGDNVGQVHALFCLVEAMRVSAVDLPAATEHAAQALALAEQHKLPYTVGRAHNYVALVAGAQGLMADAVDAWTHAAALTRQVGNRVLEPLVLMNLGVAHEAIAEPERAFQLLDESYALYRQLDNQPGAARVEANIGMLAIEYGRDADAGLRRMDNAVGILRKAGDLSFEAFAARITGEYHRYQGRLADAVNELNRARNLALRGSADDAIEAEVALAQAHFDLGGYGEARDILLNVVGNASTRDLTHVRLRLAQTHLRLGSLDEAAGEVARATQELAPRRRDGLHALRHVVAGELALARDAQAEARRWFSEAAAYWKGEYPDEPAIAARGYLGMLDAASGQLARGRAQAEECARRAAGMRTLLAARCRLFMATASVRAGDTAAAWESVKAIPDDTAERQIGPELRAAVHASRADLLARGGDAAAAAAERAAAKKILQAVRDRLPARYRDQFAGRVDVRPILSDAGTAADAPAVRP